MRKQIRLQKQSLQPFSPGIYIALEIAKLSSSDESKMAEENRNNGNSQQQVVQPPVGLRLRDIQHPVIAASSHYIRLSEEARNYELKTLYFSILPAFHGVANEGSTLLHKRILFCGPNFPFEWSTRR